MDWLSEDLHRGQTALTCVALAMTTGLIWLGRKKLLVAIPCALTFLLLAAIAIPSFIPARPVAYRNACINNLREIRDAKAEWAQANHKSSSDVPTEVDLYGTSGTNGILRHKVICPRGGTYTFGSAVENPTCSFTDKGHKVE